MATTTIYIAKFRIKNLNGKNYGIGEEVTGLSAQQETSLLNIGAIALPDDFEGEIVQPDGAFETPEEVYEVLSSELRKKASKEDLTAKADISFVESAMRTVADASPKEVFQTLAELRVAYPSGKAGIYLVAADGKWYYWRGASWTAGGVYQGSIIEYKNLSEDALRQISTKKIPLVKNQSLYTSNSNATSMYVPNEVLQKGVISIVGSFPTEGATIHLFHLKKSGASTFNVIKKFTTTVKAGENYFEPQFVAEGTGDEYLGIIGAVKYRGTGGAGMFETANANHAATSFNAPFNNITQALTFEFSLYPIYENPALVEKVKEASNILGSPNVAKDMSTITSPSNFKIYIPNVVLGSGKLKVNFKGHTTETGYFYVLEKNGLEFTVKKVVTVSLTAGVTSQHDMDYVCEGNGKEFFGYYAHSYYSATGGTGMFELNGGVYTAGQKMTAMETVNTFNFGVSYEYTSVTLKDVVNTLKTDVQTLKNQSPATQPSPSEGSFPLPDFALPRYKEIAEPIGFVGRWFDSTIGGFPCKCTINEGSEFFVKVKGATTVNMNFVVNHAGTLPKFAYSIDGGSFVTQVITTPAITVTADEHIIRVVIEGLNESEDKWIGEKGIALKDVTVNTGTVKGVLPKNKVGMFFGDSITEGVNVLGTGSNSNVNSGTKSYPFPTCENLNAISYRVGFGASGATKGGSGGVPELIQVVDKMTSTKEAPYYEPDFIVINHGTNDSGATSETFKTKYNAVLERLKVKYAGVPIFAMIPFNQAHAQDIRDCASGKPYVKVVETTGWTITFTDGVHPDVNGGIVAGEKLANAIVSVLGKNYFL